MLTVDVEEANQGGVMEELGRRGDLQNMEPDGKGRVRLEYRIPARGLIGFQGEFMTLTRGTGLMSTCSTTTHQSTPPRANWPAVATAC
jgi:GTP-binding protein